MNFKVKEQDYLHYTCLIRYRLQIKTFDGSGMCTGLHNKSNNQHNVSDEYTARIWMTRDVSIAPYIQNYSFVLHTLSKRSVCIYVNEYKVTFLI